MPAAQTQTKLQTPLGRFAYVKAFEPDDKGKYGASLILDPATMSDTDKVRLKAILDLVEATKNAKFPDLHDVTVTDWLKGQRTSFKFPFRRGGERGVSWLSRPEFAGKIVLPMSSYGRPVGVLDVNKTELDPLDPNSKRKFYSGCYGIAFVTCFTFNKEGSKGVSLGCQSMMKLKDGDPLGAHSDPAADFGSVDVAEYGIDNSGSFDAPVAVPDLDFI